MRATITKVHPLKFGHQFNASFYRVEFALEDGSWAHTDLVPTFRNFSRWKPVEVGATFEGVKLMDGTVKVDADSPARRISAAPIVHVSKKALPIPDPQMKLL